MSQLDPFIAYTVKLTMDFKSQPTMINEKYIQQPQDNPNHPMFPELIMRIFSVNPLLSKSVEKVPKLKKENVLALLYHADKQWIQCIKELSTTIQSSKRSKPQIEYAVSNIHYQQRVFFDTLHFLRETVMSTEYPLMDSILLTNDNSIQTCPKKFNESIWFAAQVLHHHGQVRHLEYFTKVLKPFASKLYDAVEQFRFQLRDTIRRQRIVKRRYQKRSLLLFRNTKRFSMWSLFTINSLPSSSFTQTQTTLFYETVQHQQFLRDELEPSLSNLLYYWTQFENKLYACYVHIVFGKYHVDHIHETTIAIAKEEEKTISPVSSSSSLSTFPSAIYHDTFTQLLPPTLERSLKLDIININMIQTLDPAAFVALPRLAILSGMTWLSHLTGWRRHYHVLPQWIQPHKETMECIMSAMIRLEAKFLKAPSEDAHYTFVKTYQRLERALVHGQQPTDILLTLEKEIYLDICLVADSILSNHYSQSFNAILYQLFKHVGDAVIQQ
ncbi:uncharacterized protein BX663DRAFT_485392 [Cokeromyces recurvatus]|uniref:uncharacterized protein n=1 Tax=Cokeromyces recurvatus TaxID=90255 RepID=UPI002220EE16|nr:uncharacterized protein BX663DRAFT_485392 [Cokeromyces recurvatus]KAI7903897.1 hypothetical protein BX663DRAFT_485392 [Cokeromyces recurvatus]